MGRRARAAMQDLLIADRNKIMKQQQAAAKKAKKKGFWSSVGRTLGKIARPLAAAAFGVAGGPLGVALWAAVGSRLGSEIGERTSGGGSLSKMLKGKGDITEVGQNIGKGTTFAQGTASAAKTAFKDSADDFNSGQWTAAATDGITAFVSGGGVSAFKEGATLGDSLSNITDTAKIGSGAADSLVKDVFMSTSGIGNLTGAANTALNLYNLTGHGDDDPNQDQPKTDQDEPPVTSPGDSDSSTMAFGESQTEEEYYGGESVETDNLYASN